MHESAWRGCSEIAPSRLLRAILLCAVWPAACAREPAQGAGSDPLLVQLERTPLRPRPFVARLSVAVRYRPCTAAGTAADVAGGTAAPYAACGDTSDDELPSPELLTVATSAAEAVHSRADLEALHVAALVDLLSGADSPRSLDRSIASLRTATQVEEHPADAMTDLAAAYILRAERTGDARDLIDAVEDASRALELQPASAPARFDLALALDRIGLAHRAAIAWTAYLAVDSTSGWAGEARARVHAITAETPAPDSTRPSLHTRDALISFASSAPGHARQLGWGDELGAWGAAVLRDDTALASARLRDAAVLGETLARRGGDCSLADGVRAIEARAHDPAAIRALARAHTAFAAGTQRTAALDAVGAAKEYALAARLAGASPMLRTWARMSLANAWTSTGRSDQAERVLSGIAATEDTLEYPAVVARARWSLGTALLRRGRYATALREFEAAERLFARIDEREATGAVQYLQADASFQLGDVDEAYRHMHRALITLRPYAGSVWVHDLLGTAAIAAAADGHVRAAVQLQREGAVAAAGTRQPAYIAEAQAMLARLLVQARDTAGARHAAALAADAARQIPPGPVHDWATADVQVARAEEGDGGQQRLLGGIDTAVATFQRLHVAPRLVDALLVRSAVRFTAGNTRGGRRDLGSATQIFGTAAADIRSPALRTTLLDRARGVFDRETMLSVAARQPVEALAFLERSRATLRAGGRTAHRLPAAPVGEVVVDYALVGDTLLTWVLSEREIHLVRARVSRVALSRTIAAARGALETRATDAVARPSLARLYDWLIRPIAPTLARPGMPLVLVADGEISAAPFAALYDTARGAYLIESHPLRFAPRLPDEDARPTTSPATSLRVLVVGDPAFDAGSFPALARLPGAAAEMAAVRGEYSGARELSGSAATPGALAAAMPGSDVLHYAGHALFDEEHPEHSFLLLAPGPRSTDGRLDADHIEALDLRRVQIVVLSACETLRPGVTRSSGVVGLAEAFLAAGAHGVVGSEWQVDDEATRPLMQAFHHAYHASGDAVDALHRAQLQMLHSQDRVLRSPATWAAFRYAGT